MTEEPTYDRVPNPLAPTADSGESMYVLVDSLLNTVSVLHITTQGLAEHVIMQWLAGVTENGDEETISVVMWELSNAIAWHGTQEGISFPREEPSLDCPCPVDHMRQASAFNDYLEESLKRDNATALKHGLRESAVDELEVNDIGRQRMIWLSACINSVADALTRHRCGVAPEMPNLG